MQIYFVTFPHRKQHVLFVYDITIPIKKRKGVSNYTNAFRTENEHFLPFNQRQSIPGATETYLRFFWVNPIHECIVKQQTSYPRTHEPAIFWQSTNIGPQKKDYSTVVMAIFRLNLLKMQSSVWRYSINLIVKFLKLNYMGFSISIWEFNANKSYLKI